jgi:VanZ family protein
VSRTKIFLLYWVPVFLWMYVIFSASGDASSAHHSSRIIGPIVHWLFPDFPENQVETIVFYVRKIAHLVEYFLLALLLWRAMRKPIHGDKRPWSWSLAAIVVAIAAAYAITDEIHQIFVPNRQGKFLDVFIDTCGAAFAMITLCLIGRWRKLW